MTPGDGEVDRSQRQGADVAPIDYRTLFESIPGLFLVLTPDLVVVDATDAYLESTMTRREDIIGRNLFDVFPDNPNDPSATGVANLRASFDLVRRDLVSDTLAVQQYDVRQPQSEGGAFEERYWTPVNVPILDDFGRLVFIVHRVEDVTEMVRLRHHESELNDLNEIARTRSDRLLAELVQRSSELHRVNQRLVELDLAKSDFLSRMSHELRTPLNSILGFGQLLERDDLTEDQFESVGHIVKAGRHLLQLLDEVLDISRIESRRMDLSLEPVDLSDVLDEAVRLMEPIATDAGVRLDLGPRRLGSVKADRHRLYQVMLNLLSNAIKYNRPNGDVRVRSRLIGKERVRISVTDTGIGIAEADFPGVFEPFARLGAEATGIEGTGIGLALTKRLVELMGGAIGFESTVGVGSNFWVEFDVAIPASPAPGIAAPVASRRITKGWVGPLLYIEDNLANLKLVSRILRAEPDVQVVSSMQGRLGLHMARELHPRMILLDLHLPDMSGNDLLTELKRDPSTASIPVVVLSADATDRQVQRLLSAGAIAYLTKPLDIVEFEQVVGALLDPSLDDGRSSMATRSSMSKDGERKDG